MSGARYIVGDSLTVLRALPDASVDLVLTSPPFLALRSYLPADHPDKALEMGSEGTPGEFIDALLDIVEECRRVLAPHGSICFELGDTYSGSGGAGTRTNNLYNTSTRYSATWNVGNTAGKPIEGVPVTGGAGWPLDKSLCLIPELFRIALVYGRNPLPTPCPVHGRIFRLAAAEGVPLVRPDCDKCHGTGTWQRPTPRWRARNVIRWTRPNPPVGALGDKFRPATSDMVIACVDRRRYFDLDAVRFPSSTRGGSTSWHPAYARDSRPDSERRFQPNTGSNPAGAPPLDHWLIPTQPYKGSHYATFPEALLTRPILAMCPTRVCTTCGKPSERITGDTDEYAAFKEDNRWDSGGKVTSNLHRPDIDFSMVRTQTLGWTDCGHSTWRNGVALDPFGGSGTTGAVAVGHGRDAILIDLDERNARLAEERIGMFCTVEHHNETSAA